MKSLYAFFVHRPLLVNLLMVFFLLTGFAATNTMQFDTFPKIDLGLVSIITYRPGASAEDIELSTTVPLEKEILKVDGLDKVTSNSMEGMSFILVKLEADAENPEQIMADIQKAVDRAATQLPKDLPQKPLVEKISSTKIPVMEVHVTGDVPEETLRYTARQLANGLREVSGIAGVEKIGYRKREVRVLLDPQQLHHLGIAFSEITAAIRHRNVRDSGGSLQSFVAEKKVVTVGQFDYPKQVEEVIIRSNGVGNYVRVRDVAEVVLDYEDWQVQARTDGLTGITLLPRKKTEADGLKTAAAVKTFIEAQRQNLPPGVELLVINDLSRFTVDMLDVLINNALAGFVLVFIVLLIFFHFQLAFWVAIGLPIAICITLTMMPLFGLGIDVMTLTGLILVLGMLVDDAIITGESIFRQKEQGLSPVQASIQGTAHIAPPVIMTTLTTVLAFAPVAFLGGLEGKFMWTLPVMALLTLGGSLIECQLMLPAHLVHAPVSKPKRWFVYIQRTYDRFIASIVRWRYISITLFILASAGALVWSSQTLRFNLYPDVNIDTFHMKVELPEGASFAYTSNKVKELESLVHDVVPEYDLLNIGTRIGQHDTDPYGVTEGRNPAWALITVYMKPQGERQSDSNDLIAELRQEVTHFDGYKSIHIEPLKDTPIQGKPVEVEIIGNNEDRFELAEILLEWLQQHPAVTEAWTSYKPGKDVVRLQLNHEALADKGLSVANVVETVRMAFDGQVIDELRTVDEKIEYRLQYRPQEQGKLVTLQNLTVINEDNLPVPLRAVTEFEIEPGEAAIKHYFGDRTVTVYGDIDRKHISTAQINQALQTFVNEEQLLQRFDKLRLWYGGELEQQEEALGHVNTAFLLCFLGIFFLLVILFNSFTQPFLVMIVIPFGFIGVLVAFSLQNMEMSLIALIGILGLTGVLVNDSLVMIAHLNGRKNQHPYLDIQGIAEGASQRLRPIMITTITTVAGLAPAAYGLAGDNPFITPMIMTMMWGVVFGTLVTLILLPCLYATEQDLRKGVRFILPRKA
jgi:multidrug efflux pump subunit AcrB